jgi:hypothetical protein
MIACLETQPHDWLPHSSGLARIVTTYRVFTKYVATPQQSAAVLLFEQD